MITATIKNPIELRKAGLRALNVALGHDNAMAFLEQYTGGIGDFTKERHEQPRHTLEDIKAGIFKLKTERTVTVS